MAKERQSNPNDVLRTEGLGLAVNPLRLNRADLNEGGAILKQANQRLGQEGMTEGGVRNVSQLIPSIDGVTVVVAQPKTEQHVEQGNEGPRNAAAMPRPEFGVGYVVRDHVVLAD
jgi:hypothetical protein